MSTRMLAISVVVSIFLTIASVSGQETPMQTGVPVMIKFAEHAAAGGQDEVEGREIKSRIVHLLEEAEEMEMRAGELRAEARELESALEGRHEGRDEDLHMREIHGKADAMREVAKYFEREGHHEEAHEIREKADTLVAESGRRDGLVGEGWRLEDGEEGDEGRAAELWTRVEDIRVTLKRGDAGPEGIERLERKLAELSEAAERAAHAGREDKARALRAEAERVAEELEAHHKHEKRAELHEDGDTAEHLERMHDERAELLEELHREWDKLNGIAEQAERDGRHERAREVHARAMDIAEQIKRNEHSMHELHVHRSEKHLEQLERQMHEARERGEEERLHHLEREAEEVRHMLHRDREAREMGGHMEGMHDEMAEHMENMHRELEELHGAAERAEREGHHDRAHNLHRRAMEVEERIKQSEREMEDRHLHNAEQHLENLEREMHKAREHGEEERLGQLEREANEVRRHLHAAREGRRMGEQLERLHGVMEELQDSYRHAVEEGRFDRAEELRSLVDRMADMVAGDLDEGRAERHEGVERGPESTGGMGMKEIRVVIRPADVEGDAEGEDAEEPRMHIEEPTFEPVETGAGVWDVDERISQLRAKARRADEAGDHDQARAFSTEARQLERSLLSMEEPEGVETPSTEAPSDDDVSRLRREVRQLRRDLEELTKALRGKIDL